MTTTIIQDPAILLLKLDLRASHCVRLIVERGDRLAKRRQLLVAVASWRLGVLAVSMLLPHHPDEGSASPGAARPPAAQTTKFGRIMSAE